MSKKAARKRRSIRVGGKTFVILNHWDGGFALDSRAQAPSRGFVDIFEGEQHLSKALIVTGDVVDGAQSYEVKLSNPVLASAPNVDFAIDMPDTTFDPIPD